MAGCRLPSSKSYMWIIDSGATYDVCNDKPKFTIVGRLSMVIDVLLGTGQLYRPLIATHPSSLYRRLDRAGGFLRPQATSIADLSHQARASPPFTIEARSATETWNCGGSTKPAYTNSRTQTTGPPPPRSSTVLPPNAGTTD